MNLIQILFIIRNTWKRNGFENFYEELILSKVIAGENEFHQLQEIISKLNTIEQENPAAYNLVITEVLVLKRWEKKRISCQ